MLTLFVAHTMGYNYMDIKGVVEGDDGLFAFPGEVPSAELYSALGFEIKIGTVVDVGHASFCGLWYDTECKNIIRDPKRFLMKFQTFNSSSMRGGYKCMMKLLRAKVLSAICESPKCPVIWAFLKRMELLTRDFQPNFEAQRWISDQLTPQLIERAKRLLGPPPLSTRLLFADEFGIPVDSQLAIEKEFENLEINKDYTSPLVLSMFKDSSLDLFYSYLYLRESVP